MNAAEFLDKYEAHFKKFYRHQSLAQLLDDIAFMREFLATLPPVAHSEDAKDAARLDFVLDNDAFICMIADGMYQLMNQDEDEEFHVISGSGEAFKTKRAAIDAAIAAQDDAEQKGGA
jgi:hypothetical protein